MRFRPVLWSVTRKPGAPRRRSTRSTIPRSRHPPSRVTSSRMLRASASGPGRQPEGQLEGVGLPPRLPLDRLVEPGAQVDAEATPPRRPRRADGRRERLVVRLATRSSVSSRTLARSGDASSRRHRQAARPAAARAGTPPAPRGRGCRASADRAARAARSPRAAPGGRSPRDRTGTGRRRSAGAPTPSRPARSAARRAGCRACRGRA